MKRSLDTTPICAVGVNCVQCRQRVEGRAWRESLLKHFSVPGNTVDFECPHGRPWETPPIPFTGDLGNCRPLIRPGDLVSMVIAHLGHGIKAGCSCNEMRRKMNEWGWWGCWRRRAELVDWFSQKAKEAGVTVERESVAGLIRTAIREAWRRRRQSSKE